MKLIKIKGFYTDLGKITLENNNVIKWEDITEKKPVLLPIGSKVELTISVDENEFLSGRDGIVWASFDGRQIEVIKNALLAQNINSAVLTMKFQNDELFILKINNTNDIDDSIDFIWKSNNGLRLKPDWIYAEGESNLSFEKWLSGH